MKTIALFAAAIAAVSTVPAAAQDTIAIHYGDIDVASPAGAQLLAERFDAGVKLVCGRPDIRDVSANAAFKDCKQAVVATGVEQLAGKGIAVEASQLLAN